MHYSLSGGEHDHHMQDLRGVKVQFAATGIIYNISSVSLHKRRQLLLPWLPLSLVLPSCGV